jgi:hypothetical protein
MDGEHCLAPFLTAKISSQKKRAFVKKKSVTFQQIKPAYSCRSFIIFT